MKRQSGLSLIEIQVSLLITFITLLAALSLYIFNWRSFSIGNTMLDIYANSRVSMELMARDIRWAAQVVPGYDSYTTSDNSLVLQIPSIDTAGDAIGASHYDYIVYSLQGSDLHRIAIVDALSSRQSGNRTVARYCDSLTFSSGGATLSTIANLSTVNTIAIYLPLSKATISLGGGSTETVSLTPTTAVRLRNK